MLSVVGLWQIGNIPLVDHLPKDCHPLYRKPFVIHGKRYRDRSWWQHCFTKWSLYKHVYLLYSFGRKPILYISGVFQLCFGLISAFMTNYYAYAVMLFFYGAFGSGGAYVTGFVLCKYYPNCLKQIKCIPWTNQYYNVNDIHYHKHPFFVFIAMEIVGPSKRTLCGTLFSVTFAFGVMLVAFWAWMVPHAQLLQIIYASHSILLLGHWW